MKKRGTRWPITEKLSGERANDRLLQGQKTRALSLVVERLNGGDNSPVTVMVVSNTSVVGRAMLAAHGIDYSPANQLTPTEDALAWLRSLGEEVLASGLAPYAFPDVGVICVAFECINVVVWPNAIGRAPAVVH